MSIFDAVLFPAKLQFVELRPHCFIDVQFSLIHLSDVLLGRFYGILWRSASVSITIGM